MESKFFFKDVTLLITHYNRSASLERLLATFKSMDCEFADIVVSDDGSKPEHLAETKMLREKFRFRLITTDVNKGLGNNINKGQAAVKTPYTLYIQEDFVPLTGFPEKLAVALNYLGERQDIDLVRFYSYFKYPYLKDLGDGFSEMKFKIWYPGYNKFYMYSDHPHLRRNNFLEKFGKYKENVHADQTEFAMMMAFLKRKGKALYYNDFKGLIDQQNTSSEPSTLNRNYWRESTNPVVGLLRWGFKHAKFNWRYFF